LNFSIRFLGNGAGKIIPKFYMKANEITLSSFEFCADDATEGGNAVNFSHIPALDGLRGIAVLIVMVYHLEFLLPALDLWVSGGFLGVDVFFVLSGFLITSVLLKEYDKTQKINLWRFYLRRFLRLMPAYWLFLSVLYFFAFDILPYQEAVSIHSDGNFIYAFFYLMNWHSASDGGGGNLNHTWSLAIEEQFYIFWSLFLFQVFSKSRSREQITLLTAGVLILLIVWRAARVQSGATISTLYYSTESRMDSLLFGCLASMIFNWRLWSPTFLSSKLFSYLVFVSLIGASFILLLVTHEDFFIYYGVLSVFAASIALIILWLATQKRGKIHRVLEFSGLTWIGRISYGLYLWHYAFYEFAKKSVVSPILQVVCGIVLAFLAATLSYYLLERPFLKLKDGLEKLNLKTKLAD
jgi:peptidoglycan/LPS O-acetylase OafA/YrhL